MKRSAFLLFIAAAAIFSLAGCKKNEYKDPNGVYYGGLVYFLTEASFIPGGEGGLNVLEMTIGSKDEFNDPEISQVFYNLLHLCFEGDVSQTWEGEFSTVPTSYFELGRKYLDVNTSEYVSEVDAVEIISGTLTIERLANGSYKVAMQGVSMDLHPISLVYEGPVTIAPEEEME